MRRVLALPRGGAATDRRRLWIEPHDVAAALARCRPEVVTQLLLFSPQTKEETCEMTSANTRCSAKYEVVRDREQLRARLRGHLAAHELPMLIDNGTYSYMIAGMRDCDQALQYRILDPHYGMLYPPGLATELGAYSASLGPLPYGSDEGKDTWQPARWVEEDFAGGDEWMLLLASRAPSAGAAPA